MHQVIIADDNPLIRLDIAEILRANGYEVVAEAKDGYDAIEQCRRHRPDFIILDIKMPLLDGLEAAEVINQDKLAGFIILMTAYNDRSIAEKAVHADVMGFVNKPVGEAHLITIIEIALNKHRAFNRMNKECAKARRSLEDRKSVDKAKGLLMDKKGMSEKSAYEYIRKTAMDKEATLACIARLIIKAYQ